MIIALSLSELLAIKKRSGLSYLDFMKVTDRMITILTSYIYYVWVFNKENFSQEFEPIQVLRPQFGTLDEIQWNMPTTWLLQMGSQGK